MQSAYQRLSLSAKLVEECLIDYEALPRLYAQLRKLEQFDQSFAIDQFDRNHPITRRFRFSITGKSTSGDEYALLSASEQSVAKLAYVAPRHNISEAFGLECNAQADEGAQSQQAITVDTSVA